MPAVTLIALPSALVLLVVLVWMRARRRRGASRAQERPLSGGAAAPRAAGASVVDARGALDPRGAARAHVTDPQEPAGAVSGAAEAADADPREPSLVFSVGALHDGEVGVEDLGLDWDAARAAPASAVSETSSVFVLRDEAGDSQLIIPIFVRQADDDAEAASERSQLFFLSPRESVSELDIPVYLPPDAQLAGAQRPGELRESGERSRLFLLPQDGDSGLFMPIFLPSEQALPEDAAGAGRERSQLFLVSAGEGDSLLEIPIYVPPASETGDGEGEASDKHYTEDSEAALDAHLRALEDEWQQPFGDSIVRLIRMGATGVRAGMPVHVAIVDEGAQAPPRGGSEEAGRGEVTRGVGQRHPIDQMVALSADGALDGLFARLDARALDRRHEPGAGGFGREDTRRLLRVAQGAHVQLTRVDLPTTELRQLMRVFERSRASGEVRAQPGSERLWQALQRWSGEGR